MSVAPPLAAVAEPVLDPAVLGEHRTLLGDGFARDVAGKFLDSAPATVALITRAAAEGDLASLAKQAHKLASGALTLGLPALNALCREAEHRAKAGDAATAVTAATRIPDALETATAALHAFLGPEPA